MTIDTTQEALEKLTSVVGVPFGKIVDGLENFNHKNKGGVGQLIEEIAGVPRSSNNTDFPDGGELKSMSYSGKSIGSIAVGLLNKDVPSILSGGNWGDSMNRIKMMNVIFVLVNKVSLTPSDWFIERTLHIDLQKQVTLYRRLEEEYNIIANYIRTETKRFKKIRGTTSRGRYLQIRTKGSSTKRAIRHPQDGREISMNSFALYYTSSYSKEVLNANSLLRR